MIRNRYLLQEAAGESGDGGGTGASLLTSAPQGGGGSAPAAGTSASNDGAGANSPAQGAASSSKPASGSGPTDWKMGLPPELQEDASLKTINDIPSLVKSYIHAQKLVGADKIPVPGKHATEDDWKNVYHRLGLPKDSKEYEIKTKEGGLVTKEFAEKFKEVAFKSNILPQQGQKLVEWLESHTAEQLEASKKAQSQRVEQEIAGLKTEWGQAFDQNLSAAKRALQKFADPELTEYIDKSGLGNDVRVIKFLAKVGATFKEDVVVGDKSGQPIFTPAQAKEEYQKILGDPQHPYFIKDHPGHKSALAEVQRLFEMSYKKA